MINLGLSGSMIEEVPMQIQSNFYNDSFMYREQYMKSKYFDFLVVMQPQIVVILLGTCDTLSDFWKSPKSFSDEYKKMIQKIQL